jgi:pyruvate kinase
MIMATLPAVHREELMEEIISHQMVSDVRYNVGIPSPYAPQKTLKEILELTRQYEKRLWVDLKGRQLRIVQWSAPFFGKIILNHEIEVFGPAKVFFRGNEFSQLKLVNGRTIFVEPPPYEAVGQGQAINIITETPDALEINGYLTEDDKVYLEACKDLGIFDLMLSFVEKEDDLDEVLNFFGEDRKQVTLALKIESLKGIDFLSRFSTKDCGQKSQAKSLIPLIARDDLFINIGDNKARMLEVIEKTIIDFPQAIIASQLFSGLEKLGYPTMADYCDLHWLYQLGYHRFLLSDGVCQRCFSKAINAWEKYFELYPPQQEGGDNYG